jgi:hypothetical protein
LGISPAFKKKPPFLIFFGEKRLQKYFNSSAGKAQYQNKIPQNINQHKKVCQQPIAQFL